MSKCSPFWFIRDGEKLIQCSKDDFDKAIVEGKSVKYGGYADKKSERSADLLEASRMDLLSKPNLPPKFRLALTTPRNVLEVQVINIMDSQFWFKEGKHPRYKE